MAGPGDAGYLPDLATYLLLVFEGLVLNRLASLLSPLWLSRTHPPYALTAAFISMERRGGLVIVFLALMGLMHSRPDRLSHERIPMFISCGDSRF